ncbi:MAG: hypothetical protein JWS12_538 [Candidatus Saccharibacteria bacterium]|nr:hypothetical protein [Candidatus Saccharibacteria bacterium]
MAVLVIRHGLSEANNRNNVGMLAFASKDAPLMEQGRQQARELTAILRIEHDIDTAKTPVATSELLRTQQTAEEAGFTNISIYPVLNEVAHGIALPGLREMLDQKKLPDVALQAAHAILENPPAEDIWVTHGLVIASLCQVLDVAREDRFIPRFCERRELPIDLPAAA